MKRSLRLRRSWRRTTLAVLAVPVLSSCAASSTPAVDADRADASASASAVSDTTLDALRIHTSAAVANDSLVVRVMLRNTGNVPRPVSWGACAMGPRLYRSADRAGAPVYDWMRPPSRMANEGGRICAMYLATATIAPGDTLAPPQLRVAIPLDSLRSFLPPGRYFVSAALRMSGLRSASTVSDAVRLDVGAIVLP